MTVLLRAALYLRVSTARQAEHDISIPDQRRQGEAYCASRGYQLVETYVEPGSTATNDRRPEFQRMIEAGSAKPVPFDIVLVHSFSRFFRDHFELEFYVRKLAKNGIKLVSITQEIGDDPMHVMMRQMMALFDEYQSKENGKHTLRAMKENARQGFWNGSRPPIGYRIVAAEQRGAKVKKKLEIDPLHADTVRLIYRLALEGDGTSGPMGVKAITSYLNARRIFTRDGGRWGIGQLHRVLTRTTYIGHHEFNKSSPKSGQKPAGEVVTAEVPPLIDQATFDAVQAHLRARNPKVTPARVVSGPTLLTGICFCAACGGAMTLRTGKSGRYRYYTCSISACSRTPGAAGQGNHNLRHRGPALRVASPPTGCCRAALGQHVFRPLCRPGRPREEGQGRLPSHDGPRHRAEGGQGQAGSCGSRRRSRRGESRPAGAVECQASRRSLHHQHGIQRQGAKGAGRGQRVAQAAHCAPHRIVAARRGKRPVRPTPDPGNRG
jgi:site-specific DNA recombinase